MEAAGGAEANNREKRNKKRSKEGMGQPQRDRFWRAAVGKGLKHRPEMPWLELDADYD